MITTQRLTLRKPMWLDTKAMVRWLNDIDVVKYSEQRHYEHTEDSQRAYISRIVSDKDTIMAIYNDDSFIGSITAYTDKQNSVANVGIMIGDRRVWGRGFGTEAWDGLCTHLLNNGIRKIEAGAMATNFGMINIFRKTEMHEEGKLSDHFLVGDELVDLVQWARF